MQVWIRCPRVKFSVQLSKLSLKQLDKAESLVSKYIEDVDRFYPWPALKESFSQDLTAIWQEQKRRRAERK